MPELEFWSNLITDAINENEEEKKKKRGRWENFGFKQWLAWPAEQPGVFISAGCHMTESTVYGGSQSQDTTATL